MRYSVVTSFGPAGWDLYGKTFVETFHKFWPPQVRLLCAWEGQAPLPDLLGFDLLNTEPARSFLDRHKDDPMIAGRVPHPKWPWGKKWKDYNFKFDAYKFARKAFALTTAARCIEGGKLFWLDADVCTHAPVPISLLDDVLPDGVSLSYLARPDYTHSECGFIGLNLDRHETRMFLTAFEDTYASDEFLNLKTWHDSFVFDWLVAKYLPTTYHLRHTSRAQPFDRSILGRYMTHLKGPRKNLVGGG